MVSPFGEKRNGIKNVGIGILPQSGQKVVASKSGVVGCIGSGREMYHFIKTKKDAAPSMKDVVIPL